MEEADNISWRRFKVLMKGLSSESALARSIQSDADEPVEDVEGKILDAF